MVIVAAHKGYALIAGGQPGQVRPVQKRSRWHRLTRARARVGAGMPGRGRRSFLPKHSWESGPGWASRLQRWGLGSPWRRRFRLCPGAEGAVPPPVLNISPKYGGIGVGGGGELLLVHARLHSPRVKMVR